MATYPEVDPFDSDRFTEDLKNAVGFGLHEEGYCKETIKDFLTRLFLTKLDGILGGFNPVASDEPLPLILGPNASEPIDALQDEIHGKGNWLKHS